MPEYEWAQKMVASIPYIKQLCITLYGDLTTDNHLYYELTIGKILDKHLQTAGWRLHRGPKQWLLHNYSYEKQGRWLSLSLGDISEVPNPDMHISDSLVCKANDLTLAPEIFGLYHDLIDPYIDRPPTGLINCFVSFPSKLRQTYMCEIIQRGWTGSLSYRVNTKSTGFDHDSDAHRLALLDKIAAQMPEEYQQANAWLRQNVPVRTFDTTLEQAIIDTKIGIVLEARQTADQPILTEKTFRALMLPRPFVLIVPSSHVGTVQYLKDLGFQLHDDLVDHTYDTVADEKDRMCLALDQIARFTTLTYSDQQLDELQQRAAHNRDIIERLLHDFDIKLSDTLAAIKHL